MIVLIAALVVALPVWHYRDHYAYHKRLRPVTMGKVYRSGCMTADGFRDAIDRYQIKTIINLMEDRPDPELPKNFFGGPRILESQLAEQMNVRYINLGLDVLSPQALLTTRPSTIDRFLEIMDDPTIYPVLIHCQAGLHRTGCLSAVYRMEYEGWTEAEAMRELRSHGFGDSMATSFNPYITNYVLGYKAGIRKQNATKQDDAKAGIPVKTTTSD